MKRLFAIARPYVPGAERVDPDDPDRLLRGFAVCFRRIVNLGRSPTPNGKYALSWWCDEARTWLRARDVIASDVSGIAYMAAVIAQGDVVWVEHDVNRGQLFEAGLLPTAVSRPAMPGSESWKRGRSCSRHALRGRCSSRRACRSSEEFDIENCSPAAFGVVAGLRAKFTPGS
jgi:hypothetical protein